MEIEIDKQEIKEQILTIPGIRKALKANDLDTVFQLCKTIKNRRKLAAALYLSGIDIFSMMTVIPAQLFQESMYFTEITIPSNIEIIDSFAFLQTLLTKVTFEEGVERIHTGAFSRTKITEVHLPKSVVYIGALAFGRAKVYCHWTKDQLEKEENNIRSKITTNAVINSDTGQLLRDRLK